MNCTALVWAEDVQLRCDMGEGRVFLLPTLRNGAIVISNPPFVLNGDVSLK